MATAVPRFPCPLPCQSRHASGDDSRSPLFLFLSFASVTAVLLFPPLSPLPCPSCCAPVGDGRPSLLAPSLLFLPLPLPAKLHARRRRPFPLLHPFTSPLFSLPPPFASLCATLPFPNHPYAKRPLASLQPVCTTPAKQPPAVGWRSRAGCGLTNLTITEAIPCPNQTPKK